MIARLRIMVLRLGHLHCGAYGGEVEIRVNGMPTGQPMQRWCLKQFGHDDSCMYDTAEQPENDLRVWARGWR